ncbi:MAG: class I SAM-dependent methyltransferase [Pseudomonadota bacterium]
MSFITNQLANHYRKTFYEHGPTPKGVDWKDYETSLIRYNQMFKLFLNTHTKIEVLDLGCGYGAFLEFLKIKKIKFNYFGIDVVAQMIDYAKKKYSEKEFKCIDIFDMPLNKKFDYIVCNGILTQKLDVRLNDMNFFLKKIIRRMFNLSTIGICFNVMSTHVNFFSPNLYYKSPSEMLFYCLSEITSKVRIDHSYGLYEYSVYLYK